MRWFCDGTFKLVAGQKQDNKKKWGQIYIITVKFVVGKKVRTVPVCACLMKNRRQGNYEKLLAFLNAKVAALHPDLPPLKPPAVVLDCEIGVINAFKKIYGDDTKFLICRIHVIRNWKTKIRDEVTGNFYTFPYLLKFWKILKGCPLVPWTETLVDLLFEYFQTEILPNLDDTQKPGFKKVCRYLRTHYFTEKKRNGKINEFSYVNWRIFDDTMESGEVRFRNTVLFFFFCYCKTCVKNNNSTI